MRRVYSIPGATAKQVVNIRGTFPGNSLYATDVGVKLIRASGRVIPAHYIAYIDSATAALIFIAIGQVSSAYEAILITVDCPDCVTNLRCLYGETETALHAADLVAWGDTNGFVKEV